MNDQRGMGLIEVIVSLGLMGLAIMGLNGLVISMMHGNLSARMNDEATRLAQAKFEQVRNAGYGLTALGSTSELVVNLGGAQTMYGRHTVVSAGALPNTKTVTVVMSWPDYTTRQARFMSEIVQ